MIAKNKYIYVVMAVFMAVVNFCIASVYAGFALLMQKPALYAYMAGFGIALYVSVLSYFALRYLKNEK